MAFGCTGGEGSGGTSDHRVLSGRTDANQHPASAISVETIGLPSGLSGATDVQSLLSRLAGQTPVKELDSASAVAIGAYRAVAFRVDGQVEPADHAVAAHDGRLAGLTLASVAAGGKARVCVEGTVVFNGWQWIPGVPVFVGRHGELTQTPPETGCVQHLGFAIGPDRMLVQIERPITRR